MAGATAPPLVIGWMTSAVANRLVFVAWGFIAAAASAFALRSSWAAGWNRAGVAGATISAVGLALVVFAALVAREHEVVDLGFRAVWWSVYHPLLTSSAAWGTVGGAGLVVGLIGCSRRRPQ